MGQDLAADLGSCLLIYVLLLVWLVMTRRKLVMIPACGLHVTAHVICMVQRASQHDVTGATITTTGQDGKGLLA